MGCKSTKSRKKTIETRISEAIIKNDLVKLNKLINTENVNDFIDTTRNPLHLACELGKPEIVEYLAKQKACLDIPSKDLNENTALHLAIRKLDFNLVKVLCENNANVNCINKTRDTPLHTAVFIRYDREEGENEEEKRFEIVQYLVNKNANICSKNDLDLTPIYYVIDGAFKSSKIAQYLLDKVNNLESSHVLGKSYLPLKALEKAGWPSLESYLKDRDIDSNNKNKNGDTALNSNSA